MKRILSFASLAMVAWPVVAQPVLTAADMPYAGLQFALHRGNYLSLSNTGPDQVWDYSGVAQGTTWARELHDLQTWGNEYLQNLFPTTEWVYIGANYEYLLQSADEDGIYNHGRIRMRDTYVYGDARKIMHYPLTYGDSWVDDWLDDVDNGPLTQRRLHGRAEGYGTLIMPSGVADNVLRVSTIDTMGFAPDNITPFIDSTTYYYANGSSWYLLRARSLGYSGISDLLPSGGWSTPHLRSRPARQQ